MFGQKPFSSAASKFKLKSDPNANAAYTRRPVAGVLKPASMATSSSRPAKLKGQENKSSGSDLQAGKTRDANKIKLPEAKLKGQENKSRGSYDLQAGKTRDANKIKRLKNMARQKNRLGKTSNDE